MILPYAKKLYPTLPDEEAALQYLKMKSSELESDVQQRLYGQKTKNSSGLKRAGYVVLRDFYDGDQWLYAREEGSAMNTTNFCRMTVDNFVAFLTQEEPEIDIPPQDPLDDVENARVREVEKLIGEILDENQFYNHWVDAVQNGSLLGDSMIVGPFWNEAEQKIWFSNVKRPELVNIIWSDENYYKQEAYYYQYLMSFETAENTFGTILKEKGIDLKAINSRGFPAGSPTETQADISKKVTIRELMDEEIHLIAIDDTIIKYNKHNLGYIPLIYVKNRPHPTSQWGLSDIEDLLDPQRAYNEQQSDMQDIIKQVAFASIFGKNLDIEEIQAGVAKIYDLGDEAEVFPDPRQTNYPFLQGYLNDTKSNIDITSAVPDIFQGGKSVQNISGRALSVLMTPVNNRIRGKEKRWSIGLKELIKNIMILMEKHVPGSEILIQGKYNCDIFFPGTLVRDVTDELNKFLQKVQSQYTTMKNIGIASPKDEQTLMKKELSDMQLAIEISKNPQMQQLLAQQAIAQARQAGELQARGNAAPVLSQDQNQGGENPAATRGNSAGATSSPEGALAEAAFNGGGAAAIIPN